MAILETLITEKSKDYELLDSGEGEKLERYGKYILARPDPQAILNKLQPEKWKSADAIFEREGAVGKWKMITKMEEMWPVSLENFNLNLKLLPSKHLGLFPEQSSQWRWLEDKISSRTKSGAKVSVLNLFAYTGGASMACARAGAEVCHVDASEFVIEAAKNNIKNSGLESKPVRFIVDDVRKFVEREIKREKKYDVILLDPPVYGKGSKKEVWKIEEDLLLLITRLKPLISSNPLALVLTGYSSIYSPTSYENLLRSLARNGGKFSSGELSIKESSGGRLLPCGIFARWSE